jgi:hypothetical protein
VTDRPGKDPDIDARCPWCSSAVAAGATLCPTCGAALANDAQSEASIPGVTQIDPASAPPRTLARPNRLVSWLAGDLDPLPPASPLPGTTPDVSPTAALLEGVGQASYAPPSRAVRREMARLELDAIKAELEARRGEATVGVPLAQAESVPAAGHDASTVQPEDETAA